MSEKPIRPGDLRSLWQTMPTDTVVMTADDMRARSRVFEKRVRSRNMREYIACGFVAVVFSWYATFPKPATILWPISNIMIALAAVFVGFNLYRLARASRTPAEASVAGLIDFQRAEYVRQRKALVTVWRWYILPMVPGFGLHVAAWWVAPVKATGANVPAGVIGLILTFTLLCALIIVLNLLGAARLQRLIEDLDRYKEPS